MCAAPKGNQGIYKITSPNGRVYVGQTTNFKTRFSKYRLLHCQGQPRLYNSFKKYGVDNHIFEIIEICDTNIMNQRERYWQEYYQVINTQGLNCKLTSTTEKKARHSEETKMKISKSNIGKKHTDEWKKEQSIRKKNVSQETRDKIRKANLGKKLSESTKEKMRCRMMGNTYTKNKVPVNARKVIDTTTGVIYDSITLAAEYINCKPRTLKAWLDGQNKNKSTLKLL